MGTGKNRINTVVSDEAKSVLVNYQIAHKFNTRDDALEDLLVQFSKMEARIKELEAKAEDKAQ